MDSKIKILIGALVVGILVIGSWTIWKSQHIPTLGISVDGKLETITDIHLPIDEIEAEKIVKKFCEPKNPNYDYGYNAIKKVNDEWRIPIYNLNCPCYAVVNIESGETNCMKQIPFETQEVTITTDKTEYEQGEMVKITVKNNLDKSIWYYEWSEFNCADSFFLEKKENGEYKYFSIPGLRKTPTKPVELKPNLEKVYRLNLSKLKEQCEGFSPEFSAGIYRLGFRYGFSIEEHWSEKDYSNEFLILPYFISLTELSKEKALTVANLFLQLECDTTFDEIEIYRGRFVDFYIDRIFGGGEPRHIIVPILERTYDQCPELEKYRNFWVAEKNISGENIIVVVGKNGEFICGFGAWGTNLEEICGRREVIITTDKSEYENEEEINIIVKNNRDNKIFHCGAGDSGWKWNLKKKENGSWREIDGREIFPSVWTPSLEELAPNETFSVVIKKEVIEKTIGPGIYKIGFKFFSTLDHSLKPLQANCWEREPNIVYSNEFTISP